MTNTKLSIIGVHHSPLTQKFGIPRQSNLVELATTIEMYPPYDTPSAFVGIEEFSHLWITWQFHQNQPQANFRPQVRPPRLGGNKKLGVFATRSPYRPSNLGLSVVQLNKIETKNNKITLHIIGADFLDKTPIIDIKPYIVYSDSIAYAKSGFANSPPTEKTVRIEENAEQLLQQHFSTKQIKQICQLIALDPRPA
ncbi:MAG: tRNA (N6-threonylcarbamoyladenosine(37)-N6)-methyltransferase TrmO, partial [Moraxellaceae bacterium]|nr:tRNA (N6-threonylcarbamoyladenosine(37)-N6)-methyltransferase TrmO [Moraxellaceae bacterium]